MNEPKIKNPKRVLAIVVMVLVGYVVGQIVASLLDGVGVALVHYPGGMSALASSATPPWWSNVAGLGGLWAGFGLVIYFAHHRGGLVALAAAWRPRPGDAWFLVLGVGLQLLVGLAYFPLHLKNMDKPVRHLFGAAHGPAFVLLAVMTVVGAPVVEEWLFRGVLFRTLDQGWSSRWGRRGTAWAVVVSALIFAAAHAEWVQLPGLFFLGLVLAALVVRTRRLVPSALTHVGFNALTLASLVSQRVHH